MREIHLCQDVVKQEHAGAVALKKKKTTAFFLFSLTKQIANVVNCLRKTLLQMTHSKVSAFQAFKRPNCRKHCFFVKTKFKERPFLALQLPLFAVKYGILFLC